ncbi:MAG: PEP-CTERM sorting domain-containing protein, partial [Patescibacteria group bacterium]|nr:PEP-CTERM sorting domain-containing protein [Patescibacteria group bacterium]
FELNSITIGQVGIILDGGLSDFGVTNRILASNGLIRLGAGGLTATMVDVTSADEARNVAINANVELTTDMTIRRNTAYGTGNRNRTLSFGGVISGGSVGNPLDLIISNAGTSSTNQSISFQQANTFVADVNLSGVLAVYNAAGLGHASNTYTLNQGVYLQMLSSGELTTENDFILAPGSSSIIRIARFANGSWTFNGDITQGHSDKALEILTNGNTRQIVFAGANQTFLNKVELWGGSKVIIAAANSSGIAWPNAGRILLNRSNLTSSLTTDLLLRGDFTLNQDIEVANITNNNRVYIGQVNDGTTPFDARFNGRINVLETDVETLHLTADVGGSATFTGEINVAGTFGLRKIGQGTVAVAGRVSQGQGTTTPIGTVTVEQGSLLVNSPGGNDSFFTTGIDVLSGATLGGTGTIAGGAVTIATGGTLAAGESVGTLSLGGDLILQSGAIWDWEYVNTGSHDQVAGPELLLPASGAVTLNILGLVTDPGFSIYYGDEFTIFTGDVPGFDPARFNLIDGASGWTRGWSISGENGLVLTAVPEPGTLLLLLAGAMGLLAARSRCSRHSSITRNEP